MKYTQGFKASIVRKTQDGSGRSILNLSKETGVSPSTISIWIKQYRTGKLSINDFDGASNGARNPGEKLSLLLESKTLPEDNMGEWLRQKGLHSEHINLWEQELTTMMNDKQTDLNKKNKELIQENKRLQLELSRKDKALAEAAVLLTLKKKYHNLFCNEEEDT